MAEMLPKSHRIAASIWLTAIMLMIVTSLIAGEADVEMKFEAALHREVVRGDLRGAEQEYKAILATPSTPSAVAARALFQLAQCFEKSNRPADAQDVYARLLKDFGDQPAAAVARARLEITGPANLKFDEGTPGKVPPGWSVAAPSPKEGDRWASLRRDGCRPGHTSGHGCAVVMVPENASTNFSELMQSFSAAPFRGKTIRLRAWLRLETADPSDTGQLWLKVDRANEQTFNLKDRSVDSAKWTRSEINTEVNDDSTFIYFGIILQGKGRVWVDDVSFEVVPRQ
jgi:hypothetical protein